MKYFHISLLYFFIMSKCLIRFCTMLWRYLLSLATILYVWKLFVLKASLASELRYTELPSLAILLLVTFSISDLHLSIRTIRTYSLIGIYENESENLARNLVDFNHLDFYFGILKILKGLIL